MPIASREVRKLLEDIQEALSFLEEASDATRRGAARADPAPRGTRFRRILLGRLGLHAPLARLAAGTWPGPAPRPSQERADGRLEGVERA
jgi:hypothetical protein